MSIPNGWELVIILVIILLLFGVGRIGRIAGEMGSGIRAFKKGLQGDDESKAESEKEKVITKTEEPR